MTTRGIEELANEVAQELGLQFSGFRIEHADISVTRSDLSFSWTQPIRAVVDLHIRDDDTDSTIKAMIRAQLTLHRSKPRSRAVGGSV
jgi:hypothetical protein